VVKLLSLFIRARLVLTSLTAFLAVSHECFPLRPAPAGSLQFFLPRGNVFSDASYSAHRGKEFYYFSSLSLCGFPLNVLINCGSSFLPAPRALGTDPLKFFAEINYFVFGAPHEFGQPTHTSNKTALTGPRAVFSGFKGGTITCSSFGRAIFYCA